ncbi:MAG: hypothetical protein Q4B90_05625 [Eubacteriales bacterium]|nr:hypothetical protein [Eubacteriales bacterium]
MAVKLSNTEDREYKAYIEAVIPNLTIGIYYFSDFFPGRTASPRLAKYLYEQVCLNKYPNMKSYGKTSAEGYEVF